VPLTVENTALVFDSTADISNPESLHPNWRMVPLVVRFGDEALLDHVEITPAEFYRRLGAASALPTTAAPSPGAWAEAYAGLAAFERIYVLPIPRRLSASAQSAEVAARELDPDGGRITVLDGRTASVGTAVLGEALQALLARGTAHDELLEWYDGASARARLVFSLETLEYLVRGGRIGRAQALVGSVLGVHPLLTLTDGEVWPYKKVRGRSRVLR
jgi:DegV family protein with EDD domain